MSKRNTTPSSQEVWETSVFEELRKMPSGRAHLSELYAAVEKRRLKLGLPTIRSHNDVIRRVVQDSPRITQSKRRYKSGVWEVKKRFKKS